MISKRQSCTSCEKTDYFLTTSGVSGRIWGLGSRGALVLIAVVNLQVCGGSSCCEGICGSVWLHRRWSAHEFLLLSHICSASALSQCLIRWTLWAKSKGLPLPYVVSQSHHNLVIWSAWEWIRWMLFLLAARRDEGLSQAGWSPSSSLFTCCSTSQRSVHVLDRI